MVTSLLNKGKVISRIFFAVIIIGAAYYVLIKVQTQKVDILELLKKPSQSIPTVKDTQQPEDKVSIQPKEFIVKPLYQEFNAHITNKNDFPIYDYAVEDDAFLVEEELKKRQARDFVKQQTKLLDEQIRLS